MKRNLFLGLVCIFGMSVFSQEDPVLMRINGKETLRSEFEYLYRRHCERSDAKLTPKEYSELFINHKLKVAQARAAGMDTVPAFRKQQEAYRTEVEKAYLTDERVADSCARVLYNKTKASARSGQVQVMQIFRALPQTATSRRLETEQSRMDSIYEVIKNQPDLDFVRSVDEFSDDKRSLWIKCLQTTSEFENMAFSLAKGEVSKPFFTPQGIHILWIMDRREMPEFEAVRSKMTEHIRSRQGLDKETEVVVERLKKEYQYVSHQAAMEGLLVKGETEQTLFTIDGRAYTGEMFKRFASSYPQSVKRQLKAFVAKSLLDYERKNLENKHPEVCHALQAHWENSLVSELTHQKVNMPVANDRVGLATYFKFHESDYRWETPRYRGAVLHCVDKKTAKRAKKIVKKAPEKEWADLLRKTLNTSGAEVIKVEQGVFAAGDNKYIDKLVFKKGDFEPITSYPFTVSVGWKQKGPDDYREVADQVRKDYLDYLDVCWTRDLRESGKVEINQEVLKTVNND